MVNPLLEYMNNLFYIFMVRFSVLIEGYAKEIEGGWIASSSTVIIYSDGMKIIADPGINRELLQQVLQREQLNVNEVDIVFVTHHHPDHAFLTALFNNATVIDSDNIYKKDTQREHTGSIPNTDIKIIKTPGHTDNHASLMINTDIGLVSICGDIFWWTSNQQQVTNSAEELLNKSDPFEINRTKLLLSRRKILEIANWIIPGHGKIFKNPRK